ncbi:MAG: tetratricopeptide repeat protein [Caldilineaceae bacterium]
MATLMLTLFGSPTVTVDKQPVHIGRRKALALLAYLAVTQRPQSRAHLAALLWPEYDEAGARAELRRALSTLNQALGSAWLAADRNQVTLVANENLQVDVLIFRAYLAAARHKATDRHATLLAAVALAQATLLSGFTVDDAPDFEEWQRFEAAALQRELAWALDQLSQPHADQEPVRAIAFATRWLALDPLDEAAQRRLMTLHALAGDPSAAYRQYQICKDLLARELGVPPAAETTALYAQIRDGSFPPTAPHSPRSTLQSPPSNSHAPLSTAQSPPHNLPAPVTPLIGRNHELEKLHELLADPTRRLVSVIGPGGIGKTRVALQAARQALTERVARWRDGVYLVNLTAVDDWSQLATAVATMLPLTLQGSTAPEHQLLTYLRGKKMLLVLDNFEQLLPALNGMMNGGIRPAIGKDRDDEDGNELEQDDLLTAILRFASGVTLLVTSRERLNLQGETPFSLLGMPFPPTADATAMDYAAIQLFVDSAQRTDHRFVLSTEALPHVVRICQMVQGMPLAIMLAAAWTRLLSCAEIAEEIGASLDFLATTTHNLPARHQSMRAVFEHSWQLLTAMEQRVLCRLAVFRSGFPLAAGKAVAQASLPILLSLLDKSLIWRDEQGRYHQHELLRQYGEEKLQLEPGVAQATRHRAARWYATLLEEQLLRFKGDEQLAALQVVTAEWENIHYAWQWLTTAPELDLIERAAEGIFLYCFIRQLMREGLDLFDVALRNFPRAAATQDEQSAVALFHTRLLLYRTIMYLRLGLTDGAALVLQRCLAQCRAAGLRAEEALALSELGRAASTVSQVEEGRAYLDASLHLWHTLGEPWYMLLPLSTLCYEEFMRGNFAEAQQLGEEMLALARSTANHWGIELAIRQLGLIERELGNHEQARAYLRECLAMVRRSGNRAVEAYVLENLASIYFYTDEIDEAEALLHESLRLGHATGQLRSIGYAGHALGEVYLHRGEYQQAIVQFQTSRDLFREQQYRWAEAYVLSSLAQAYAGLQAFDTAFACAQESIAIAKETESTAILLTSMAIYGELLAKQGEFQRAAELVRTVMAHPKSEAATIHVGNAVLALLADHLPAAAFTDTDESWPHDDDDRGWDAIIERFCRKILT